jgi:hypothetical protein
MEDTVKLETKVVLRPTVRRTVYLGFKPHLGSMTRFLLLSVSKQRHIPQGGTPHIHSSNDLKCKEMHCVPCEIQTDFLNTLYYLHELKTLRGSSALNVLSGRGICHCCVQAVSETDVEHPNIGSCDQIDGADL